MAQILDGREISEQILTELKTKVGASGHTPVLAIVLAGGDESAAAYVRTIVKTADKASVKTDVLDLGDDATQDVFIKTVTNLAENNEVNGIIIQTPASKGLDLDAARSLIPPEKDIDGANPLSAGRLFTDMPAFAPATAQAVVEILKYYQIELAGKNAVVIGRSRVVGKPAAQLLLNMNATVSICHSGTPDLSAYTKNADVVVAAAGQIGLINGNQIGPQAVIVDVGTNFTDAGKMVGDVDFDSAQKVAKAITPVPGGVGPVTTAVLLKNTFDACLKQNQNSA